MTNSLNLAEIDQEQALNLSRFFIRSNQNIFLFGRRGVGKQLCLNTEIPTPNGFVKLLDLKEGDQLFDEKGKICNVVKLHPINLSPESFRITFDDGSTVDACADHQWLTWDKKARKNINSAPAVRTTKDILKTLKTNYLKKETNHSILNALPIEYDKKNLIIDPYVLGCWLGDGQNQTGSIECADIEIIKEIESAQYKCFRTKKSINNKSKSFNFRLGDLENSKITEFATLLKVKFPQISAAQIENARLDIAGEVNKDKPLIVKAIETPIDVQAPIIKYFAPDGITELAPVPISTPLQTA